LPPEQYKEVRAARLEVKRAFVVGRDGNLAEAARITAKSIEVFERTIGLKYHDHVVALANLAAFQRELGDLGKALPLQERAVAAAAELFGKQSPEYSVPLSNLALLYGDLRDYPRAIALAQEDVALRRSLWGREQPVYAVALQKLGSLCIEAGQHDAAIDHLEEAMEIQRRAKGDKDRDYASMLHTLAMAYSAKKDLRRSKQLYEQVVALSEATIGKSHFDYVSSLNNLASVNQRLGLHEESVKQLREVVDICNATYGAGHPERIAALRNLGASYLALGDCAAAEPYITEALTLQRNQLDDSLGVLSERQQLLLTYHRQQTLHMLLTAVAERKPDAAALYDHVLAWKGSVYLRQRQSRIGQNSPKAQQMLGDLQAVSRQIANLNSLPPAEKDQPAWRKQFGRYIELQEQIEAALARESINFAELQAATKFTATDLQANLPADAVLFDFVEYEHWLPSEASPDGAWRTERRLAVFVVKRDKPVKWLTFGSVAPLAALLQKWRGEIMKRGGGIAAKPDDTLPQYALLNALWQPLAEHAAGCKTLMISPDGFLASFPWAALPGDQPGKYLIEQYAIVTTPIPRQLGVAPRGDDREGTAASPALCLLGGIDFGKGAQPSHDDVATSSTEITAQRLGEVHFTALPGSAKEVDAIAKLFRTRFPTGRLAQGAGEKATEERVRQAASQFNHLHFATHGFFVDEMAAADSPDASGGRYVHPGLFSGIALAGANRRGADSNTDDGILTALEVASLDLNHVELVVLSACETGLGTIIRGEGVLGLQRAFQLAGARTSLTSLWQVDDAATQSLMIEFYRHHWQASLGSAEALRQAQLTMLDRYDPRASALQSRGLVLIGKTPVERAAARLAPYYWAAFVLSGDEN
jgi:CHAT domain-containing protein